MASEATHADPVAQPPVAEKTAFNVLTAISFCHLLNDMVQSLIPALYPILKESFRLDFTQIGMVTLVNQATASLLQPVVGSYTDAFHPRMVGLTGSPEQVGDAARAYRVYYARQGDEPDTYMMDHSSFSYLVLPEVGFVDFVNRDEPPEAVAARMACFVEAASA